MGEILNEIYFWKFIDLNNFEWREMNIQDYNYSNNWIPFCYGKICLAITSLLKYIYFVSVFHSSYTHHCNKIVVF